MDFRNVLILFCLILSSSLAFASGLSLYFLDNNFMNTFKPYAIFVLIGYIFLCVVLLVFLKLKTRQFIPVQNSIKGIFGGFILGLLVALLWLNGISLEHGFYSLSLIDLFAVIPIIVSLFLGMFFFWVPIEFKFFITLAIFFVVHAFFWATIGFMVWNIVSFLISKLKKK